MTVVNETFDDNPLAHSTLVVTITDLVAEFELNHRFRNAGTEATEAVYSFPVPLEAAFMGMDARLAGERLSAQVQPRSEATRVYDDALAEGDSAVLLEQLEPGLLCVNLGNLAPGEDGEITLRFAAPLHCADGSARFTLPLVHRPRYGRSSLDELTEPEHDFAAEHPLDASIRVRGLLAQAAVSCATHGARFAHSADGQELQLNGAMLDRDLLLAFELPAAFSGCARRVCDGDDAIGVVSFNLPADLGTAGPCDLCLVLDCSGSMSGDAIRQSRAALEALAGGLGDDDHVQVLRFGSAVEPLFRRPLKATWRVRSAMLELAETVRSNLGGTRMAGALQRAIRGLVDTRTEPGQSRAIVLVTDGAVHPDALEQAQAEARRQGIGIFVVAVGSSAGTDVLAPLAQATGAMLERAVPAEPIDAAVMRQLRRARAGGPVAIDVDWGSPQARPLPIEHAFAGDAVTAIALLPAGSDCQPVVRLAGGRRSQAFEAPVPQDNPALRALAGQIACRHARDRDKPALALRYGLITAATSAVLVKVRAEGDRIDGLPQVVPVRHMTPHGMVDSGACYSRPDSMCVASDVHEYKDEPRFLRRGSDQLMAKRDVFGKQSMVDEHLLDFSHTKASDPVLPGALRQALVTLLLDHDPAEVSLADILDQLDVALQPAALAYLWDACPGGIDRVSATHLLHELLEEIPEPKLNDDQEGRLALLDHSTGARVAT